MLVLISVRPRCALETSRHPYLLKVRNNRTMQEFMVRKFVAPDDPRWRITSFTMRSPVNSLGMK